MKILLSLIFFTAPLISSAQTFSTIHAETGSISGYIHVALMPGAMGRAGGHLWYLGDGKRWSIVTDEASKAWQFGGAADMFNWLHKQGYDYVCAIPATDSAIARAYMSFMFVYRKD